MGNILEAKNVKKAFRYPISTEILKDVCLTLTRGESVAIMGSSGEGKTTLLHILGALEEASSGEIFIDGHPLSQSKRSTLLNSFIGFVFQAFHLLEDYNVIDNVLMPARIARKSTNKLSAARKRAESLLEEVGLSHRLTHFTKLLSGGEKQRVAIARALCNDPPLILADEPTGNLDHESSKTISQLLLSCVKEGDKSLLIVTHDQELASLCDRTLILRDGVLMES